MSASSPPVSARAVFAAFLRLGLTSFGGPVAHLGFFREEFVRRRRWLSDAEYADVVALAQFLPGPASSQVGFAVGYLLAGARGALAAWAAFTLPSALLLAAFALLAGRAGDLSGAGWVTGLKLAAVAVVAQAVAGMWGTLVAGEGAAGRLRTGLALGTAAGLLLWPGAWAQLLALLLCALVGWRWLPAAAGAGGDGALRPPRRSGGGRTGLGLVGLALAGLVVLPLLAPLSPAWAFADHVYRAGALVFGGGHVVLPLLEAGLVPGFLSAGQFLAGYGAANAVPGPLFTFASYLGAAQTVFSPLLGAVLGTVFIFVPGLLLMLGALPLWAELSRWPGTRRALGGLNAGVVGLLLAALYDPVFTAAVHGPRDLALALLAYAVLTAGKVPAWAVVLGAALVGGALLGR
ncbi:chromate efflux transporter [Deinococcus wulumuqiensis]|uniref:Chromate transporter n=9 Tax=Deinococcus wulumuqiensis TaxID=980427 RepID=A0AAV4K4L5_9DEIO|nr:chromate efflux transporter [Deinococcus wulumuqiensis]QII21484.1 chromate efflux transporter [Deinococcus wulumuqiensis R12]GGI84760.1 chromate transporter [Deinococcus wulumuqiensis]GGP29881.1 chromate transporter [Deinococcus wulumuqiensis]